MAKLKHKCEECDSEFVVKYEENEVADRPTYCVFCASYILDEETEEYDEE